MSMIYVISKGQTIQDIKATCVDDAEYAAWLGRYYGGTVTSYNTDNNPPQVDLFKAYAVTFNTAGKVTNLTSEYVDIIHRDQIIANPVQSNNVNMLIVKVIDDTDDAAIESAADIRQAYLMDVFGLS